MDALLEEMPKDLAPAMVDLFANEPEVIALPDLPKTEEVPIVEPLTITEPKKPLPFDLTTLLLTLRALPDVKLKVRPPFGEDGTYNLDVHNKARWVLVAFNEIKSIIQIDHFMDFNSADGTWNVLNLKEVEFKEMDAAINHIKSILEI
jgi:hypothetical protein